MLFLFALKIMMLPPLSSFLPATLCVYTYFPFSTLGCVSLSKIESSLDYMCMVIFPSMFNNKKKSSTRKHKHVVKSSQTIRQWNSITLTKIPCLPMGSLKTVSQGTVQYVNLRYQTQKIRHMWSMFLQTESAIVPVHMSTLKMLFSKYLHPEEVNFQ